jgi:iron complex transport system ATP-binding protein
LSIQVNNLSFSYGDNLVLKDVSFTANDGELMAVLGPNGVGKSTLFRCMLGLLREYRGETLIDGESTRNMSARELARRVAYIPQSHYPAFNYSVFDMILMGTIAQVSGVSSPGKRQIDLVNRAMDRLKISHLRNRGYTQISGGERQLTLIARALAQEAKVLIMDEPTSNLDYGNQLRVMAEIKSLAEEGYTIIESSHSPDQAFMYADRILAILDGQVLALGSPRETINRELIRKLYGVDVEIHSFRNDSVRICVPNLNIDNEGC